MGVIQVNPGSPLTIAGGSGSKVYAFNTLDDTTPVEVAPANSSRQSITFHNPGTVDVFIAPAFVSNTGSFVPLVPATGALGGCFRVYANGGSLTITGENQQAWQALSESGSGNPLTVMESNV